ncbi:MAG: hypothetical protein ICV75_08315 [Nitrospiraceae bacterium]|nr:hypothetical protein [Nitrospiraceae bacterium]
MPRYCLPSSILMVMVLLASMASAGGEAPELLSRRWSSWFTDQGFETAPKPADRSVYQANFTRTSYARPAVSGHVRDLIREAERPRAEGVLASTTWLKGAFTTETEVVGHQGGTAGFRPGSSGDSGHDPSARMMRLGISGSLGSVRYGMRLREAGSAFHNGPDQAQREVWGEWKHGLATVRSALGDQWDNVTGDPTRSRTMQQYAKVGVSISKQASPTLDLTYSRNAVSSTLAPIGIAPQQKNNHTVEAALGYGTDRWKARVASSYSLETDLLRQGDNRVKTQTVTASFRPLDILTIAPTLGYRAERQDWSGARIDSPSVSLAMNYQQSQQLIISALANYSETRSSDRLIEMEQLGGKGIVAWDLQQSREWSTQLSVEGGYHRQLNLTTPSAQQEDLSGLLRLVLSPQ